MELIKLITLSVLITLCCAQSGDMPSDEPMPPDESMPSDEPMPPTPTIILVTVTRAYRDESTYQAVYDNMNDTNTSIYEDSAPYRYARYNVSNLLVMTLLKV